MASLAFHRKVDTKTLRYCPCNGTSACCKFFVCVKSNRQCIRCLPMKRANSNKSAASPPLVNHEPLSSTCSQPSVPVSELQLPRLFLVLSCHMQWRIQDFCDGGAGRGAPSQGEGAGGGTSPSRAKRGSF